MAPDQPWSTWTSGFYLLAGALVVAVDGASAESYVFAVTCLALMIGTMAMHWKRTKDTQDLDHAGMNASFAALAVWGVGATWPIMAVWAVAGFLAEYKLDVPNHALVVALGSVPLAALMAAGQWGDAGGTIVCFAGAFLFWQIGGDKPHALWHILSAAGMFTLALGVA